MKVILWVHDNGSILFIGPFDDAKSAQEYAQGRFPPQWWQIHALTSPEVKV